MLKVNYFLQFLHCIYVINDNIKPYSYFPHKSSFMKIHEGFLNNFENPDSTQLIMNKKKKKIEFTH